MGVPEAVPFAARRCRRAFRDRARRAHRRADRGAGELYLRLCRRGRRDDAGARRQSMNRWPGAAPTRRRFIAIAAAATGLPFAAIRAGAAGAETAHLHRWSGIALGAAAQIVLHDPDGARARRLIARCVAEIDRLEDVFSLYRPESAIRRLNRDGRLAAPPLELVALLAEAPLLLGANGGRLRRDRPAALAPLCRAFFPSRCRSARAGRGRSRTGAGVGGLQGRGD